MLAVSFSSWLVWKFLCPGGFGIRYAQVEFGQFGSRGLRRLFFVSPMCYVLKVILD